MMRKMIMGIAVFGIMSAAIICSADDTMKAIKGSGQYGAAGCGLGSMVFGNQTGLVQVFAATTNGTVGSQTFGITTGTSNCGSGIMNASNEKLHNFVSANMDLLAQDMSRGSGEYLEAVAELMAIPQSARPAAYVKLQGNFSAIFTSEKVESAQVVNQMTAVLGL